MVRSGFVIVALIALALAGCNKSSTETPAPTSTSVEAPAPAPAPMSGGYKPDGDSGVVFGAERRVAQEQTTPGAPAVPDRDRQWMAYSHTLWLVMDAATVEAHFTRARDFCLTNAALNCILLSGSANAGDENAQQPPSAQLAVSLPHDQVAAFQKALFAPLGGQTRSDIVVRQQSTQADNLTQQVTDIDQRVGQLTTYRDRLSVIAERPNIKAEDLIPLEEKISELQSELDQLVSSKANIVERVKREQLSISFTAKVGMSEATRPVSHAWDASFEVLGNSASTVLLLLVAIVPWIPVALLIWLVVWLVRRNKKSRAVTAAPVTPVNEETLKTAG